MAEPALVWYLPRARPARSSRHATYALISNTGTVPGEVKVSLSRESGAPWQKTVFIEANSRYTFDVAQEFAEEIARDVPEEALGFGLLFDSTLPLIVERSHYASPKGLFWAAGDATLGTPIP